MVTIFVLKVSVMSFILKCEQYQKSQFVMADPVLDIIREYVEYLVQINYLLF